MLDVKRLISEVASRNGIRLDEDDPAFCLVTISQIMLEETAAQVVKEVRIAIGEFERAVESVHRRSGAIIAAQTKDSIARSPPLVGSEPETRKVTIRSDRIRWVALGLVSGLLIFAVGILAGISFR